MFYQICTFILFVFIFLIPVQLSPFITAGILTYALLILLHVLFDIFSGKKNFVSIFLEGKVKKLFIAFLIISFISTLFSVRFSDSILNFTLFLAYFVVFCSIPIIFPTVSSREKLAEGLVLLVTVLSVIADYNSLIRHYVNRQTGAVSFLWNYFGHNHLAALHIFAIPLGFYFLQKTWITKQNRFFWMTILYILIFSFTFTFARLALISLILASFLSLCLFFPKILNWKTILAFLSIIGTLLIMGFSLGSTRSFGVTKAVITLHIRMIYWMGAMGNFQRYPLWGSGLNTYKTMVGIHLPFYTTPTFYAHNFYLQMLSDSGIFGFTISMLLIVTILYESGLFISIKKGTGKLFYILVWTALVASVINSLGDFDWQLPSIFLLFWIFGGLLREKLS